MKTDQDLQKRVMDELAWDPSIDATKVGVIVHDGIVTLTGHVPTYTEKTAAERITQRVSGVKAVVQEIDVKLPGDFKCMDEDIAQAAINALRWNTSVPDSKIQLKVEDGWITLDGTVDWNYQREAVRNAVDKLAGVLGVTNRIYIKSSVKALDVKTKIKHAFERNAILDADNIQIRTEGSKVTLEGTVQSWAEKQQAQMAAWAAPGVSEVVNNIGIVVREHAY